MVTVRKATVEDINDFCKMMIGIAEYHNMGSSLKLDKNKLIKDGFSDRPLFEILLAEVDNEIAGYLSYTYNYSIWLSSYLMNIDDVFIWEKFRGKKIGVVLMQKAKEICKERGLKRIKWEVEKNNEGAIKFYKRLGASINIKGVCTWDV